MNIIVPVDFSENSVNAAHFSSRMLTGNYGAVLYLYHSYEKAKDAANAVAELEKIKKQLMTDSIVKIETVAEESDDFIESLERKVRHLDADLVVMSIKDKSKFGQAIDSSNSLRMIEKNLCPVLVVPEKFAFNEIRNVALASDFKDVANSIPIVPVKRVLSLFRPNLHIVNINSEIYVSLNEEYLEQRGIMQNMFQEFNPEFYFITTYDFHETLRQFIDDKNIDLVLTFPRKHSFISNMIKGNNTKKLVMESSIPVLAAHS
jgi:nucleotide-binding universal stress UspA family protein